MQANRHIDPPSHPTHTTRTRTRAHIHAGIDPSGKDIWIHDCNILNDDDSIAVKPKSGSDPFNPCTENLLIENLVLTGFGASIGSVRTCVVCVCVCVWRVVCDL